MFACSLQGQMVQHIEDAGNSLEAEVTEDMTALTTVSISPVESLFTAAVNMLLLLQFILMSCVGKMRFTCPVVFLKFFSHSV